MKKYVVSETKLHYVWAISCFEDNQIAQKEQNTVI